LDFEAKMLFL